MCCERRRSEGKFGKQRPSLRNLCPELRMVRRIGDVQAASQHGEGSPAGCECSFMSHPVDAARHPADNGKPEAAQLLSQRSGDANPIECGMARANDGDGLYI